MYVVVYAENVGIDFSDGLDGGCYGYHLPEQVQNKNQLFKNHYRFHRIHLSFYRCFNYDFCCSQRTVCMTKRQKRKDDPKLEEINTPSIMFNTSIIAWRLLIPARSKDRKSDSK
jgi:hypothetical protein